jgi:hypothetical protein
MWIMAVSAKKVGQHSLFRSWDVKIRVFHREFGLGGLCGVGLGVLGAVGCIWQRRRRKSRFVCDGGGGRGFEKRVGMHVGLHLSCTLAACTWVRVG